MNKPFNCNIWLLKICASFALMIIVVQLGQAQDTIASDQIRSITWSPQGDRIAVTYQNGQIQIVNTNDGQLTSTLQADTSLIFTADWSPDGRFLATGSTSPDNALRICDTISGQQTFTLARFGVDILTVAWRPDGQQIIATTAEQFNDETNAVLVDPITQQVTPISFGIVSDIAWSSELTKVAMVGISSVSLFDAVDFHLLFEYSANREIFREHLQNHLVRVTWSQDGTYLAAGMGDGRIFVWHEQQSEPILTLIGHDYEGEDRFIGWIYDLRFDHLGQQLTSVAGDGTIRTWDVKSGTLVAEQKTNLNYTAAFSPYGGRVALGLLASDSSDIDQSDDTILKDVAVQIIVPDASIEKLQSIAGQCFEEGNAAQVKALQEVTIVQAGLSDFISQVEALPTDTIPAACQADLIAVAEAIIAQE